MAGAGAVAVEVKVDDEGTGMTPEKADLVPTYLFAIARRMECSNEALRSAKDLAGAAWESAKSSWNELAANTPRSLSRMSVTKDAGRDPRRIQ